MKIIVALVVLISTTSLVYSQEWEGYIIYNFETLNKNNQRDSLISMMMSGMDTTAVLYLKKNFYKLVSKESKYESPGPITLYHPDSTRLYQYLSNNNEYCTSTGIYAELNPKITKDDNDIYNVLGMKCTSITFDYGMRQTKVYFSTDIKVDTKSLENDPYGFLLYIKESHSLPLRVIMSGDNVPWNMVYTARAIHEEALPDSTFVLPNFKFIMKM